MVADYATTGLTLGAHPMALLRPQLPPGRGRPARDLETLPHETQVRIGGLVVARQRPGTAKGIVFLLLEDEFGTINLIVPPTVYERHRLTVRTEPLVLADGRLERLPIGGRRDQRLRRATCEPLEAPRAGRGSPRSSRSRSGARAARARAEAGPTARWRLPRRRPAGAELRVRGGGDDAGRRSPTPRVRRAPPTGNLPRRWPSSPSSSLFVALGLGVLFVALSGGPGGARRRLASQSRAHAAGVALLGFLLAVVILGLGVPAAVIATVKDAHDVPEAGVSTSRPLRSTGRELFGERCAQLPHAEGGNAVAQVGPNLDELRPPKALVLDAIHNGRARGNGQMAADLVEGQDAEDVAEFVAKAVGQTGKSSATPRLRLAPSARFVISPRVLRVFRRSLRCGAAQPLSSRKIREAGDPGRWGESLFA